MESVTLDQAVERALKNNPTVGQAIQGILRAEALLQQARAVTLPQVNASFTGVVNSTERKFDDVVTSPRMQGTIAAQRLDAGACVGGMGGEKSGEGSD